MRLRAEVVENRVLRYGAIVGAGVIACLVAAWSAGDGSPASPAADALTVRVPPPAAKGPMLVTPARAAQMRAEADRALFIPYPTYRQASALPRSAAAQVAALPQPAPQSTPAPAAARHAGPQLASVSSRPAPMPPPRHVEPSTVFNDSQIASMKRRLNLTPDQERMWPSVEAALRKLAYAKAHDHDHDRSRKAAEPTIDLASGDVQDLKYAAFPLIMSFSDDQRRELMDIAHVAGLEKLVPQF
jgi:hypothetical protein